jgi:xanthine dehydrogenase molybdopterin-binding subunit B/xanthine dehydrogenase iron-sulfur cluster and FAD-binding subunit A
MSVVRIAHGATFRDYSLQNETPSLKTLKSLYNLEKATGIVATYRDDEGDCCSISCELELNAAFSVAKSMASVDPLVITLLFGDAMSQMGVCPGDRSRNLTREMLTPVTSAPVTEQIPQVITEAEEDWDLLDAKLPRALDTKKDCGLLSQVYSEKISFTVNGTTCSISSGEIDPRMKLSEYLRYNLGLTGTKVGCGEGGCGACTVHITRTINSKPVRTLANACLRPVFSLGGAAVLTTEGLMNSKLAMAGKVEEAFHPLQAKLAECDGSQCGYCSPGACIHNPQGLFMESSSVNSHLVVAGMVMAMYGLLSEQTTGGKPAVREVEERLQGNICRCTGYRSIYKAMHTFSSAADAVVEAADAVAEATDAVAEATEAVAEATEATDADGSKPNERPTVLAAPSPSMLCNSAGTVAWFNPTTLGDVQQLMATYANQPTRLTVGNTSEGVVKYYPAVANDTPTVFINLATVPELAAVSVSGGKITAGSAVTLSALIKALESCQSSATTVQTHNLTTVQTSPAASTTSLPLNGDLVGAAIRHLNLVAHWQVRDVASWAGNLMIAKSHPDFPSDVLIVLSTLGAVIQIRHGAGGGVSSVTAEQLVSAAYTMNPTDLVVGLNIDIPSLSNISAGDSSGSKGGGSRSGWFGFMSPAPAPAPAASRVFGSTFKVGMFLPISCVPLTPIHQHSHLLFFKVMGRHANAHALVNAGFKLALNGSSIVDAYLIVGNIQQGPLLFPKTQSVLKGCPLILDGAEGLVAQTVPVFKAELEAAIDAQRFATPVNSGALSGDHSNSGNGQFLRESPEYRISTAVALYYKFIIAAVVANGTAPPSYTRSLSAATFYQREISSGTQSYPTTGREDEAPLGLAVHKVEGGLQSAGLVKFTSDLAPSAAVSLFGGYVLADKARVAIASIDASAALAMPGVKSFISAKDVAAVGGTNSISTSTGTSPIFATTPSFVGQVVGMVIATSEELAQRAARVGVTLHYASSPGAVESRPVVTEADARLSSDPSRLLSNVHKVTINNKPETASGETAAPTQSVSNTISTAGQKHFYMECQSCLVVPSGAGSQLTVRCATQCINNLRQHIAAATNRPESKVTITNTAIGGAYGGKAFLPALNAAATAIAALTLGKPVVCQLDRNTDMSSLGGRPPCTANFTASFDSTHAITDLAVDVTVTTGNDPACGHFPCTSINAYTKIAGAKLTQSSAVTNAAANTIMRAPGDFQGAFFMEAVIEAVASEAKVPPMVVQMANMDVGCASSWTKLQEQAGYDAAMADAESFNKDNRWRKRGVYMLPVKYTMSCKGYQEQCFVNVSADGSISVDHSGIECGQGINTKVQQAALNGLGEALPAGSSVTALPTFASVNTILPKSTDQFPHCTPTYGSGTSESCVNAVERACAVIAKKLKPLATTGMTWTELVAAATTAKVIMSATGEHGDSSMDGATYTIFTAACSVVELDVLTGEVQVLRADVVYDCGKSLNPAVDVGQVEGSFVQAMGFVLTEEQVWSATDGRLLNNGTWDYKPPSAHDIPVVFNVTLLDTNNDVPGAILGSKGSGEAAQILGTCPFFALKQAIYSARSEAGTSGYFRLDAPATPARVQQACLVSIGN